MPKIAIALDSSTATFYNRIAQQVNLPLEQVLADTLFKLAGELSLEALHSSRASQ